MNYTSKVKKKYYVVKKGRHPGVYFSWPDCQKEVQGFPHAVFKGFASKKEAEAWYGKAITETAPKACATNPFFLFSLFHSSLLTSHV